LRDSLATALAMAVAAGLCATAIVQGTWAAGGSDSSCYALMADAFAHGELQPTSVIARAAPWPNAHLTTAPAGFIPSPVWPDAASPVCAPGFSLLLTPLVWIAGHAGFFLGTPIACAILVWVTFVFARALAGPLAGAAAALLIATTPIVLFQAMQPMNDITTAMLWMAVLAAATGRTAARERWMGGAVGLALLVRPNLAPCAVLTGVWVLLEAGNTRARVRRSATFAAAAGVPVVAMLLLNAALYGHPLRAGYGDPGVLFSAAHVPTNLHHYGASLLQTTFGIPLLGLAAPLMLGQRARRLAILALGVAGGTTAVYLLYRPFDEWWYLRFLLPAVVPSMALGVAVVSHVATRLWPERQRRRTVALIALVVVIAAAQVRLAEQRQVFNLDRLERRFWRTGDAIGDRLPSNAIAIAVWQSGTVRFHAGRDSVLWDSLDPAWLDRAVEWLTARGYDPYVVVERWEEPLFRARFAATSRTGQLDWPPRLDIDREVRVYRPADRDRYLTGEAVPTVYVTDR
jgi:hypothetical protein